MAIILPGGFNITNNEPVDARLTLVDETAKYALSSANVYEGLIVFQQDNNTIWVLTDTSNVANSNGWTQVQIGSVSSNLPSGVVSGSDQVTSSLDSRYVNETDFTSFSSSVDLRLDLLESNSSSLNNLFEEKASGAHTLVSGSSQVSYPSLSNIPAGIVSGSSQVTPLLPTGVVSGSSQVTPLLPTGVVSGSSQVSYPSLLNIPAGIISGSSQLSGTTITDLTIVNLTTVNETASVIFSSGSNRFGDFGNDTHEFTGSVQITGSLTTIGASTATSFNGVINATNGVISGSTQLIATLPSGVISGSSQVNADSITNFDTNVKDKLNADTVVSGSSQITKTLQEVTTAGNTTSTSISITNNTASTSKTTGALVVTGGIGTSGDIFAGGDVVAYASSDIRLKDNVELISNPLQKINQIGGYSFVWNEEKQNIYKGTDYGVIAQEIEQILPELVDTRENGYKAVKYDKLVSLLIEGIKDLSKQVEELKEKINNQ